MARHRTALEKQELSHEVRALRLAGVSRARIRTELGIGDALLSELVRGIPVPEALARPRAKDDARQAALALRQGGSTYQEIAVELGVSKGSLSLWLGRGGSNERHTPPEGRREDGTGRRESARAMRADGWLLREIAADLSVSLTSAVAWTRGQPVPARARHGGDDAHMRVMSRKRWDRELADREAAREAVKGHAADTVGTLSDRELDLIAATAYWCEGSKDKPHARREKLAFINSDPGLIRMWLEWLDRRGVDRSRLRLSLSIHESADLVAATAFWADVVGCDVTALGKPWLKRHNPATSRKNTGSAYVGCLVVRVLQSKELYQEIAGRWRGIVDGASRPTIDGPADVAS